MNLYFSRKFTYFSYEDHVKYAQITMNAETRCFLLDCIYNLH